MKKRWWLLIFGVIALGLLVWSILSRIMSTQSDVSETDQGATVLVAAPRIGAIERVLSTSGTLTASKTIRITSKVPGRIERILVEDGQPVAEGEFLVQIEEETARLQVKQAYATWQAAQAQYDKARKGARTEELQNARALYEKAEKDLAAVEESFTRSEKLYKSGAIAKVQYEQAEAAKANYELACLQVEFTRIKAPESGVIARVLQDEGNIVATSTPILVLVQDDRIQVEIEVAEKYYGEILHSGELLEARIFTAAYPGSDPFRGRILTVAPTIDPASRTFTVTVDIEDPKDRLRPGMYAEVEIVLERVPDALLVPASAVLDRAGEKIVFVAEGTGEAAVAAARGVVPGLSSAGEVQILSGIDPGDNVIVEGNTFLEQGQRIGVLEGE